MKAREWLIIVGVVVFALALAFAIQRFDTQFAEPPPPGPSMWVPPPAPRERPFNPITTDVPPSALPYPAPDVAPPIVQTPIVGSPIVPANVTPDPAPRPR